MFNHRLRMFLLVVPLVALLPAPSSAEDTETVLKSAAKVLGADSLKTIQYSGSGSSYRVAQAPGPGTGWTHAVMKSYVCDLDLDRMSARVKLVRSGDTPSAEETVSRSIDPTSPWLSQYEFWITPYGFLKGVNANKVTVESKVVFGTAYRAVSFTLPGNHKVVGYINDKDIIEKVETWIGDNNDVLVEAQYRDYADFDGVKVPSMITQKHAGELSLILIVNDVKLKK